jgi:predicted HTH transcriptional regulator
MELKRVRHLVSGGESVTVEFKRKVAHPEKIIKELVAFANTRGGYLFIGVNDDGTIPGLKFPEDHIYSLEKALEKYCRPALPYDVDTIQLTEDRWVVLIHVEESERKPHYIISPLDENKRITFVRAGDKSIQASREVKEIIRRSNKPKNIKFHYGDKEKKLFEYLEINPTITLPQFSELASITTYMASRTLILLTLANVLKVDPDDKGDRYSLVKEPGSKIK